jgi:hypothetical protein
MRQLIEIGFSCYKKAALALTLPSLAFRSKNALSRGQAPLSSSPARGFARVPPKI